MGWICLSSINLSSRLHHPHQEASKWTKMLLCSAAALALASARTRSALGGVWATAPMTVRNKARYRIERMADYLPSETTMASRKSAWFLHSPHAKHAAADASLKFRPCEV